MSTASYSRSERGGGRGETGRMRAAIVAKIGSWVQNADWEDPERAERMMAKLHEAPEKFVTPNPDADHKEEASRCYGELKDEFGLRTKREAEKEARTWEERADRHFERKQEEAPDGPESPEEPEPEPEPDTEPDTAGATQEEIQAAIADALDESDTRDTEPDTEPESEDIAALRDEIRQSDPNRESDGFDWRGFGAWVARRAGAGAGRLAKLALLCLVSLTKRLLLSTAYGAGRGTVLLCYLTGRTTIFAAKTAIATLGFIAALLLAFGSGAADGVTA